MVRMRKGSARAAGDRQDVDDSHPNGAGSSSRPFFFLKVLGVLQVFLLVAFGFIAMKSRTGADAIDTTTAVRILDDESLPSFIAGLPNGTLLNFHSPECPHCKALEPEFEAAARELQSTGGAPLAAVNVAVAPKAAERYKVTRYPTLLWFRFGEPVLELPYNVRQATKIVEYVEWAVQPAVVTFENRAEFDEAIPQLRAVLHENAPPLIAGFAIDNGVYSALEMAAERSRGKTVFLFTGTTREGDPALRAIFRNESSDHDFRDDVSQAAVRTWVAGLLQKRKLAPLKATQS